MQTYCTTSQVLDSNGTQVFEKKGLTAKNSEDTQTIKFPAPGTHQLVLTITGLQSQPDQKSETPPPVDCTRNGIARGTVVVSEQTNETAIAAPAPVQSSNNLTEQPQSQQNQTGSNIRPNTSTVEQYQQPNRTAAVATKSNSRNSSASTSTV